MLDRDLCHASNVQSLTNKIISYMQKIFFSYLHHLSFFLVFSGRLPRQLMPYFFQKRRSFCAPFISILPTTYIYIGSKNTNSSFLSNAKLF